MLDYVLKALIISTTLGSGGVTAQAPPAEEVYQEITVDQSEVQDSSEIAFGQETEMAESAKNDPADSSAEQQTDRTEEETDLPVSAAAAIQAQAAKEEAMAKAKAEEEKRLAEEKAAQEKEALEASQKKDDGNYDYDIASYITYYSTGASVANRNHNMQLAIDAINGEILKPGESFSYNECLLSKRNPANDYKEAGVLSDGVMTTGIGGGICQVSSTLFNAALYSDMTITARRNHSAKVGYLPAGRDATCSWGSIDFCFRNDLTVPVKIDAWMKDGTMKIRFLADGNPEVGDVKVNVAPTKDGGYLLTRTVDGKANYTTYSKYK